METSERNLRWYLESLGVILVISAPLGAIAFLIADIM